MNIEEMSSWDIAQYLKNKRNIAFQSWEVDDVLFSAANCNVELTEEDAIEIIQELNNTTDASIGITWELIDTFVLDYAGRKEQFTELQLDRFEYDGDDDRLPETTFYLRNPLNGKTVAVHEYDYPKVLKYLQNLQISFYPEPIPNKNVVKVETGEDAYKQLI